MTATADSPTGLNGSGSANGPGGNADGVGGDDPARRRAHHIQRRTAPTSLRIRKQLIHIPLIVMSVITLFPFLAMVIISLHPGVPVRVPDLT